MIKLELGAGDSKREEFYHTDLYEIPGHHLEKIMDARKIEFADNSVNEIFMEGVFEHFTYSDAKIVLQECFRVLTPMGKIEFTTPDLESVCRIVVENKTPFEMKKYGYDNALNYALSCLYGGQDRPGQIHQWGWTHETLKKLLEEIGFSILVMDSNAYQPGTHIRVIAQKRKI